MKAKVPNLPTVVYHADWGTRPQKRWFSMAVQQGDGYKAHAPAPVDDHGAFISHVRSEVGISGTAVVGFDFPIGIPARYAALIGAKEFKPFLLQLEHDEFADFYRVSERAADISVHRPFYPYKPGGTKQSHLLSALGLTSINDLRRKCELGYAGRKPACPLFWTLGPNQVGKAAIIGWRYVLVPALNNVTSMLWPFDGSLDSLL